MKVLLIDTQINGHHIPYMTALLKMKNKEFVLVLPSNVQGLVNREYIVPNVFNKKYDIIGYIRYLFSLRRIIKKEKPDVVHFLCGDEYRRYFGFGFSLFRKYKTLFTIHKYYEGRLNSIAMRRILSYSDIVVTHSSFLKEQYQSLLRRSITHIEYPQLYERMYDTYVSRDYFDIHTSHPVIGSLGGTRDNKGLDFLLEALKVVPQNFVLLIAGKEEDIKKAMINDIAKGYQNKIKLVLRELTDAEFSMAVSACDIIVLPYRQSFNGASGPLTEGVWNEKMIIGPSHGNLGFTIAKNHLGMTFESENIKSLADTITNALRTGFLIDECYKAYRKSLSIYSFICSYERQYDSLL